MSMTELFFWYSKHLDMVEEEKRMMRMTIHETISGDE